MLTIESRTDVTYFEHNGVKYAVGRGKYPIYY